MFVTLFSLLGGFLVTFLQILEIIYAVLVKKVSVSTLANVPGSCSCTTLDLGKIALQQLL